MQEHDGAELATYAQLQATIVTVGRSIDRRGCFGVDNHDCGSGILDLCAPAYDCGG